MTTTNMALVLATVSETLGPEWAELLNTIIERLDEHDHSDGNGARVTPAGLTINDDLDIAGNHLLRILTAALNSQGSADTTKTGTLQRVGSNLYWVNGSGNAVQLTSGSSVVSTGSGALRSSVISSYPHSVTTGDDMKALIIDSSSARTLNLPAASNTMAVWVKDGAGSAQTNNISIVPDGTDLIDGANTTYTVDANYASVCLVSDGVSKWYVV